MKLRKATRQVNLVAEHAGCKRERALDMPDYVPLIISSHIREAQILPRSLLVGSRLAQFPPGEGEPVRCGGDDGDGHFLGGVYFAPGSGAGTS